MSEIKRPAVAGLFYPAEPDALQAQVEAHVARARAPRVAIKALVAPHAGYVYSGPIAGTGYTAVKPLTAQVRRIVLLGPAHRVRVEGIAAPSSVAFATPLGAVPVDREAMARALALPGVAVQDAAFAEEHSLEVHLPFLQHAFKDFTLVPLLVGAAPAETVERVLAELWGGPETLIVVSSDLSHYKPYDEARTIDRQTASRVEALDHARLDGYQACGCRALAGLLRMAQRLDLRATTLDLRNSGDTAGDKRRVVGYATIAFEYAGEARLADDARRALLETARRTIEFGVKNRRRPKLDVTQAPLPLHAMRRSFVTVTIEGRLRGCVGAAGLAPLAEGVMNNAYGAAFDDPRFKPLTAEELGAIAVDVSILSHPRPIAFRDEAELLAGLQPDVDGLIIEAEGRRALFLPSVWEKLREPKEFLGRLKQKAGLAPDYWSPNLRAWRYRTESFGTSKAAG
jgi:AmmeMemoRadiSam system protein B/AmmeMemoRadiSam system protein A